MFPVYSEGEHEIKSTMDDGIPLFLRAGQIILTRERARRNSALQAKDPYTMYIATDAEGKAKGSHFDDDGRSYECDSVKTVFAYEKGVLGAQHVGTGDFHLDIERIVVLSLDGNHRIVKRPGFKTGQSWINKV